MDTIAAAAICVLQPYEGPSRGSLFLGLQKEAAQTYTCERVSYVAAMNSPAIDLPSKAGGFTSLIMIERDTEVELLLYLLVQNPGTGRKAQGLKMGDGGVEDNRQQRRSKGEWQFIHGMAYVRLPTAPCVGRLLEGAGAGLCRKWLTKGSFDSYPLSTLHLFLQLPPVSTAEKKGEHHRGEHSCSNHSLNPLIRSSKL